MLNKEHPEIYYTSGLLLLPPVIANVLFLLGKKSMLFARLYPAQS